jgi:MFS family permease
LGSALLVVSVVLPQPVTHQGPPQTISSKLSRGIRIYLATPRLRGLLALTLTAAAGSSMVIVNTIVIVRHGFVGAERDVALVLALFGAGSMAAAFALPPLLERWADRTVMVIAGVVHTVCLLALGLAWITFAPQALWIALLAGWFVLGGSYAGLVIPGGRLLRRSSAEADRPALFAAQFSLSHTCWLIAYPLAGWVGAKAGVAVALGVTSVLACFGLLLAWRVWPASDPVDVPHNHADLAPDHPHLVTKERADGKHAHPYVIDDLHRRWPTR